MTPFRSYSIEQNNGNDLSGVRAMNDDALLKMADNIGSFIEYWGFKKVHGKIWTLVFLSPTPVDANYLKDTLGISKALTSMSIKDLLHFNVIMEVQKERPGTQKYVINPNITQVILDIIKNRELKMLGDLKNQQKKLKSHDAVCPQRAAELSEMIDSAHAILKGMVAGDMVDFQAFEDCMTLDQ